MFQNFQNEAQNIQKNIKNEFKIIETIKSVLQKQNLVICMIAFMISMVNLGQGQICSPFSLSLIAALFSNQVPIGVFFLVSLLGTVIGYGISSILSFILIVLVFATSIIIIKPLYNEDGRNESIKVGKNIFLSTLAVYTVQSLSKGFLLYDFLVGLATAMTVYVFYKIFSNSIIVIEEFKIKKAFTIEEVIGASILVAIAITALGELSIFGFSLRNILSIFIVLALGWQNGMLVGATSGISIGMVLGVIGYGEPVMIAAYALSGMIAGVLNKFGKIGVIAGFILGNVILSISTDGSGIQYIYLKEILIAAIGLLAMPKSVSIDVDDIIKKDKCMPKTPVRILEEGKNTVEKLNTMSETINDMVSSYKTEKDDALDDENKKLFIQELLNQMDLIKENMLYSDLVKPNNNIVSDLYNVLTDNEEITREELLKTFAKNNNYIISFNDYDVSKKMEDDLSKVIKAINEAYKQSKVNFVYEKKIEDRKRIFSDQLKGVSRAISGLANELENKLESTDENFKSEIEKVKIILKQKKIELNSIKIDMEESGRYLINVCLNTCNTNTDKACKIEKIEEILTQVLGEKIVNTANKCPIKDGLNLCNLNFSSADKYTITLGISKKTKDNNSVSGDTFTQMRLTDGKYLIAISDGMGSGPEAQKSSKIAIKMLERLLASGFNKETSIDLINSAIKNSKEETFTTLDIAILDLYKGNIEFIKNGTCPTYIKSNKKVQLVKSLSLPAGVMDGVDITSYNIDIDSEDIMLMCTDGILDANVEYKNKELWVKYMLEDIETSNVQKISDIILNEAIDNNFGQAKDDMTVITCKFINNI